MNRIALSLVSALFVLVACAPSAPEDVIATPEAPEVSPQSAVSAPFVCDNTAGHVGHTYFEPTDSKVYLCNNGAWTPSPCTKALGGDTKYASDGATTGNYACIGLEWVPTF